MTSSRGTNGTRKTAEAWWPLVRDVAAFVLGAAILLTEQSTPRSEPIVIGAGLALIGVTGAGRLQEWARRRTSPDEKREP